jgi:serine/threonine protein kinase
MHAPHAAASPMTALGTVLGDRYELSRLIARGGMGEVFEARDLVLQRSVAAKVFRGASPLDRSRFDAEARVLARLEHPGLATVFDVGEHDGDAYVILELIDGPTLSSILSGKGTLGSTEAKDLGLALAEALSYIHARGVVHRDITPANVMCDRSGRPRLVDFGIARLLDSPRVTSTSMAIGTVAFMAPEQALGKDVTPAADIYSLGLVLLEALTGRREFRGSPKEVATARLVRDPDTTDAPGPWRSLLGRMTKRDPHLRPSADEVAGRLRALDTDAQLATAPIAVGFDATRTQPIPAALRPTSLTDLPPPQQLAFPVGTDARRRTWWAVLLAGVVAAIAFAAINADGGGLDDPTTTSSTVAEAVATTAVSPSTTPPTVVEPTAGANDRSPASVPAKPKKDKAPKGPKARG